jgi:hypothetical protein
VNPRGPRAPPHHHRQITGPRRLLHSCAPLTDTRRHCRSNLDCGDFANTLGLNARCENSFAKGTGILKVAKSLGTPPGPSCGRAGRPSGRSRAPGARLAARRAGSSAGCWPVSPCALRWVLGVGPCRSAPAGRRRRGTRGARCACGGATERQPRLLIATHRLAVDEAGPNLAMVHGLHDENNPAEHRRLASRVLRIQHFA